MVYPKLFRRRAFLRQRAKKQNKESGGVFHQKFCKQSGLQGNRRTQLEVDRKDETQFCEKKFWSVDVTSFNSVKHKLAAWDADIIAMQEVRLDLRAQAQATKIVKKAGYKIEFGKHCLGQSFRRRDSNKIARRTRQGGTAVLTKSENALTPSG